MGGELVSVERVAAVGRDVDAVQHGRAGARRGSSSRSARRRRRWAPSHRPLGSELRRGAARGSAGKGSLPKGPNVPANSSRPAKSRSCSGKTSTCARARPRGSPATPSWGRAVGGGPARSRSRRRGQPFVRRRRPSSSAISRQDNGEAALRRPPRAVSRSASSRKALPAARRAGVGSYLLGSPRRCHSARSHLLGYAKESALPGETPSGRYWFRTSGRPTRSRRFPSDDELMRHICVMTPRCFDRGAAAMISSMVRGSEPDR